MSISASRAASTGHRRAVLLVAAALLALLVATTARAENAVSLRISNAFITSGAFDVFAADNRLVQVELNYARLLLPLWHGTLWADISYLVGPSEASLFNGQLRTKSLLHAIVVGGVYKLPVWSWFVPYARLGVGVLIGALELTPQGGDAVRDRAAAFTGHALLGCELLWPRAEVRRGERSITGGLLLEAGYSFASPLGFELRPAASKELREIPLSGVELGVLQTSGVQVRVGAVLRF